MSATHSAHFFPRRTWQAMVWPLADQPRKVVCWACQRSPPQPFPIGAIWRPGTRSKHCSTSLMGRARSIGLCERDLGPISESLTRRLSFGFRPGAKNTSLIFFLFDDDSDEIIAEVGATQVGLSSRSYQSFLAACLPLIGDCMSKGVSAGTRQVELFPRTSESLEITPLSDGHTCKSASMSSFEDEFRFLG